MSASHCDDRGAAPAPDRSGDLHPLQHLRGDLPGRRGHARLAQLRRRRGEVQLLQRLHLALPDRRDRQLAAGRQGEAVHARRAARLGQRCPRRRELDAGAAAEHADRRRADHVGRDRGPGRRRRRRRGRRRIPTSISTRSAKPAIATVTGNFRLTAEDATQRHPPHRARFRRHRVSGAGGPDDRHRAAGRRRERQAASRAPLFGREPARRRAAALQQPLADGEARHRGPRRQAGARRRVELPVRPREGRRGEGRRARTARRS